MNVLKNNKKKILTTRFDLAGSELSRISRILFLNRLIPMGNLSGGGGIRCLMVLMILHVLGGPIFRLLIHQEQKMHALHMILNRLRK